MLKLRFKDNKYNTIWLVEPKLTLGSGPENDLVLNHPDVEKHHADIHIKHEQLILANIAGRDDVLINNVPVKKAAPLKADDALKIAGVELEVVDPKTELKPEAETPAGEKHVTWGLKSNHSSLGNRVFPLKAENVVGRSNECDISLGAAHLSRRHAHLFIREGLLYVKDLDSSNGTYVNGVRVSEARVKRGDEIRFDTLSFGVIGPSDDTDKTTVRPASVPLPPKKQAASFPPKGAVTQPSPEPKNRSQAGFNKSTETTKESFAESADDKGSVPILWIVLALLAGGGLLWYIFS